jgi:hypothetical protein
MADDGLRAPTDACLTLADPVGDASDVLAELVELAMLSVCWCCTAWIDRIDDTDELVDLRPRSPELARRYVDERGVGGAGLTDRRLCGVVEALPPPLFAAAAEARTAAAAPDSARW